VCSQYLQSNLVDLFAGAGAAHRTLRRGSTL
jgi:hypothetical protein